MAAPVKMEAPRALVATYSVVFALCCVLMSFNAVDSEFMAETTTSAKLKASISSVKLPPVDMTVLSFGFDLRVRGRWTNPYGGKLCGCAMRMDLLGSLNHKTRYIGCVGPHQQVTHFFNLHSDDEVKQDTVAVQGKVHCRHAVHMSAEDQLLAKQPSKPLKKRDHLAHKRASKQHQGAAAKGALKDAKFSAHLEWVKNHMPKEPKELLANSKDVDHDVADETELAQFTEFPDWVETEADMEAYLKQQKMKVVRKDSGNGDKNPSGRVFKIDHLPKDQPDENAELVQELVEELPMDFTN